MQPVGTSISRFYSGFKVPNTERGPLNGDWDRTFSGPPAYSFEIFDSLLSPTKHDVGEVARNDLTTNETDVDFFFKRFWTPPLKAQDVSGMTFQFNMPASTAISGSGTGNVGKFKVHAYITVGQTPEVRTVLADNFIDSSALPTGSFSAVGFSTPIIFPASSVVEEGDSIVFELGVNFPSYTPAAPPTTPPSEWIIAKLYTGSSVANQLSSIGTPDLAVADTSVANTPWFEFSAPLSLKSPNPAPINDACADAIDITSLPFFDSQDTSNSQCPMRGVYYTWTADADKRMIAHGFGTRYAAEVQVYEGSCGTLGFSDFVEKSIKNSLASGSQSFCTWDAVNGTTYTIQLRCKSPLVASNSCGGDGHIYVGEVLTPAQDDIFYPVSSNVVCLRDGNVINATVIGAPVLSGIAVDYTGRSMEDFSGAGPTNTNHRLLVGVFDLDFIEILDLPTLNAGQAEIDFTSNTTPSQFLSTVEVDQAGQAYLGFFGTFHLVSGSGNSFENEIGTLPEGRLAIIDATHGSQQSGAPYTFSYKTLTFDKAATDYISLNTDESKLFYTSSGQYVPLGGTKILVYNVGTDTQDPDFATIPTGTGPNPGPKGIKCLPDGGALVCNGSRVYRFDAAGTVIQTYDPSPQERSATLADVDLIADGTAFWVMDSDTASFYKFDLESGAQIDSFWTHLGSGSSTSFVVYRADVPPLEPIIPDEGGGAAQGCVENEPSTIGAGEICTTNEPDAIT
jgi:hypothetical protein